MGNSNPSWRNISIPLCAYMHTSLCMYCSTLGALYTDSSSISTCTSINTAKEIHANTVIWKFPSHLSTKANKSYLLVPFHTKGGPITSSSRWQTCWRDISSVFLPWRLVSPLLPSREVWKSTTSSKRISRSPWHAPKLFSNIRCTRGASVPRLSLWNLWVRMEPLWWIYTRREKFHEISSDPFKIIY